MTTTRWPLVRLEEVVAEALPGFAVGERDPHGVVQLRMNNVDTQGHLNWSDYVRVPATSGMISKYRLLSGDVVFNNTNSTALVGKSARFAGYAEPVVYSNHFTRLRPVPDRLDSAYLAAWLLRLWQQHTFEDLCNRWIGQSAVNREKLLALEIPLPSVSVQKRIVAKLDEQMVALDRAEKALAEQAAMLDEMSIRVLHEALAGTETGMWPLRSLGEVTTIVGGSTPSTGTPSFWNGQIVWITPADLGRLNDRYIHSSNKLITEAGLQSCSTQVVPVGSVVLSSRAPIGHLGIAGVPLCTNQGCKSFIPGSGVDSTYLYYALKASVPLLQDLGSGATFKEVSKSDLSTFRVLVPSIQTQRRVSASLTAALDATSIAAFRLAQKRQGLIVLRSALLDAAFSGEV